MGLPRTLRAGGRGTLEARRNGAPREHEHAPGLTCSGMWLLLLSAMAVVGCGTPRLHYALAFERTLIHCSAPATLLRAPARAIGRQDNYYAKHFQVPAHHSVKIPARWGRFPDAFQVLLAQCRVQCRFPGA